MADIIHRGCGFVEFNCRKIVSRVLKAKHSFRGQHFDCKRALNNEERLKNDQKILSERRKVYLGNLDMTYSRQDIYDYFVQFADIEEVIVIKRNDTEQFSFITFKTPFAGDIVCSKKHRIKPDQPLMVCEMAKMEQVKEKKLDSELALMSSVMLEDTHQKSLFYSSEDNLRFKFSKVYSQQKYSKFIEYHLMKLAKGLSMKMDQSFTQTQLNRGKKKNPKRRKIEF